MSNDNRNKEKKKKYIARTEEAKTVRKIVAIIILSIILIFIIGGLSGFLYIKSALDPVDKNNDKPIKVMIPLGSSSSSIGNILEEHDVIKDARVFRFYTKFKNKSNFQAGEYTFTKSLSIDEIIDMLKDGKLVANPFYSVTIPEGKTIDEIAELYAEELPFTKDEFLEVANDEDYINELMTKYPDFLEPDILQEDIRTPLEGYLYAATYSFYEEKPTIEAIIEEMLEKTVDIVTPYQEDILAKDLTIHEAITFASLVEKEARTEEQRKRIAGVFYNRLAKGMKLQTDPTVLYALGEHKDKVLYKDLEIESPYNTYYIETLPIGPISNFSKIAFESVVYPEESNDIYFLHDDEGNIYYAEDYEEHLRQKEKYIE